MITMTQKPKSAKRLSSARENGSEGGRERASRYSGEVLSQWASRGGQAVLHKYGPNYFIALRKRRKNYLKRNESPVVTSIGERGLLGKMVRRADWHGLHFTTIRTFESGEDLAGLKPGAVMATSITARSGESGNTTRRAISPEKP